MVLLAKIRIDRASQSGTINESIFQFYKHYLWKQYVRNTPAAAFQGPTYVLLYRVPFAPPLAHASARFSGISRCNSLLEGF